MKYYLLNDQDAEDIFIALESLGLLLSKLCTRREFSTEFSKENNYKINMNEKIKKENKVRREKFLREQKNALEQNYDDIIF